MTLDDLVKEVRFLVDDPDIGFDDVVSRLNRGYRAIAGLYFLPWLVGSGTVDTDDTISALMPTDYIRNLFMATVPGDAGAAPRELTVFTGVKGLSDTNGKITVENPSDVIVCCESAGRLIYQPVPSEVTTITLSYYKKPDNLEDVSDNWNNDDFDDALINFAAWKLFKAAEDSTEDNRGNGNHYKADYLENLEDIKLMCYRAGRNFATVAGSNNKTW